MQCEIHGCQLGPETISDTFGGALVCPACRLNKQSVIERDNLGRCIELNVRGSNGRLNLINDRLTPLCIGDQYQHREHGTGMIKWINPNNKAKYPIKMHFSEKHVFCYFNIDGMQFAAQKHPSIDFPKVPKPQAKQLVLPASVTVDAAQALRNLGAAFKNLTGKKGSKWDKRFIALASHVAQWSKDPSTKVGAVIVDSNKRIVSIGFNGYPQNIPDDDLDDRDKKYAKVLHAEMNAMLFAQRNLEGCTIYVWPMPPCSQCASAIIQSGIDSVRTVKATKDMYERWGDKIELTEDMFEDACVDLEYL